MTVCFCLCLICYILWVLLAIWNGTALVLLSYNITLGYQLGLKLTYAINISSKISLVVLTKTRHLWGFVKSELWKAVMLLLVVLGQNAIKFVQMNNVFTLRHLQRGELIWFRECCVVCVYSLSYKRAQYFRKAFRGSVRTGASNIQWLDILSTHFTRFNATIWLEDIHNMHLHLIIHFYNRPIEPLFLQMAKNVLNTSYGARSRSH